MIIIVPLIISVAVIAWLLYPGKSPAKPRKIAVLAAVIPPLFVAIAAAIFQILHNTDGKTWVSDISNTCFIISITLVGAAILAAVVFVIVRKWEIAKGIGFGVCISVFVCVIELAVLEWLAGV